MQHEKPLSPHLQIYKPQLTSVLSIFHRISGFSLGLGALHFLCFIGVLAYGAEQGIHAT
ncbi:MAG: succinate:quinone oxidoreductase subunit C, partial [Alphaproteobacteria bacterium]|nr:succinate:quinone oxidoreductase subunit C [Alphaproteobacteria bacterium]